MRYLNLPLTCGRLSSTDWQPVVEKVERCGEGCLVLLQLILSAIPLFHLSIFKLPVVSQNPRGAYEEVLMERRGV